MEQRIQELEAKRDYLERIGRYLSRKQQKELVTLKSGAAHVNESEDYGKEKTK